MKLEGKNVYLGISYTFIEILNCDEPFEVVIFYMVITHFNIKIIISLKGVLDNIFTSMLVDHSNN